MKAERQEPQLHAYGDSNSAVIALIAEVSRLRAVLADIANTECSADHGVCNLNDLATAALRGTDGPAPAVVASDPLWLDDLPGRGEPGGDLTAALFPEEER